MDLRLPEPLMKRETLSKALMFTMGSRKCSLEGKERVLKGENLSMQGFGMFLLHRSQKVCLNQMTLCFVVYLRDKYVGEKPTSDTYRKVRESG